ncbi:MAG: hypothetical protein AB7O73_06815 [Bacteroidia bacterium]
MRTFLFCLIFIVSTLSHSQEWKLVLKSTVALRTWNLTTKANKSEKMAQGANIQLSDGSKILSEVTSDLNGNFELEIPGGGDYYLTVTYPSCSAKKFYVSTKGVPVDVTDSKKGYKPSIKIGGFMMSKPFSGIDYIGLQEPLLKVEYKGKNEGFDKDKVISDKGEQIVQKITDSENLLIDKFCNNNKRGDEAFSKKQYEAAKNFYTKALELIPNEEYPKFKLEKVEAKLKEEQIKKDAEEAKKAAEIEAAKAATQKAIEEKQAKEKELFEKAAKEQAEKELAKKQKEEKTKSIDSTKVQKVEKKTTPTASINSVALATNTISNSITNNQTGTTKTSESSQVNSVTTNSVLENMNTDLEQPKGKKRKKSKYKMAHKMNTDMYNEHIEFGNKLFEDKRFDEAKKHFEAALKIKPDDDYAKSKIKELDAQEANKK